MRHTEETKRRLSEMRTGKRNPMYGRRHSDETKAKIGFASRETNAKRQYVPDPQKVSLPTGEALGYLAGLLDGEGSVRFRAGRPFVAIYGERSVVEWLVTNVGGSFGKPDTRGRVPCYCWSIAAARDVLAVCRAVSHLLIVKKEDAMNAIAHLEAKYGEVVGGG